MAHGSGRSTPDFDLLGALNRCSQLFTQFGGHRMAAGVTLEATKDRGASGMFKHVQATGA